MLQELSKAVHSLARIGNELYVEGTAAGLILRTVNDSHTAYAVMKFHTGFFTRYQLDSSEADKYANTCKVSMKSCLGVFKNTRQVTGRVGIQCGFETKVKSLGFSGGKMSDLIEFEHFKIVVPIRLHVWHIKNAQCFYSGKRIVECRLYDRQPT